MTDIEHIVSIKDAWGKGNSEWEAMMHCLLHSDVDEIDVESERSVEVITVRVKGLKQVKSFPPQVEADEILNEETNGVDPRILKEWKRKVERVTGKVEIGIEEMHMVEEVYTKE